MAIIITIIGYIITFIGSMFVAYRKDGIDKNQLVNDIKHLDMKYEGRIKELETALKARCTYSDLEREIISKNYDDLKAEQKGSNDEFKECVKEFRDTLKETNELLQDTRSMIREHIAFHQGKEGKENK